jgi:hypothetical protein
LFSGDSIYRLEWQGLHIYPLCVPQPHTRHKLSHTRNMLCNLRTQSAHTPVPVPLQAPPLVCVLGLARRQVVVVEVQSVLLARCSLACLQTSPHEPGVHCWGLTVSVLYLRLNISGSIQVRSHCQCLNPSSTKTFGRQPNRYRAGHTGQVTLSVSKT